jgi:hypothetical protein
MALMESLTVQYGDLNAVLGPVRTKDNVSIVSADVTTRHGPQRVSPALFQAFADYAAAHAVDDEEVKALVGQDCDAPWVRGRVEKLFFAEPIFEADRSEKTSLHAAFIAVVPVDGQMLGVPFECTDYYFKSSVRFSSGPDEPPRELREQIAVTFWRLLLEDPWDVKDYTDRMTHGGAGVTYKYGIKRGSVFVQEDRD